MSILSLLSGVVMAGLIYGFSFVPTATLTRYDDDVAGLAGDSSALPDPDVADAEAERREREPV